MNALITGARGFVGAYMARELRANGRTVTATDILPDAGEENVFDAYYPCDMTDAGQVNEFIARVRPDEVYHLAGQSNVRVSWDKPALTMLVNTVAATNLLEALRLHAPGCSVVIVGSADEYGVLRPEDCPVTEEHPLAPHSPYAVSKRAQEDLARLYAKTYGMRVVMTRSFNHIGRGQRLGFVATDFANAVVQAELGKTDRIRVGNLEAHRDFSDVRDVVRAYRLLAEKGRTGEVYNVGSGKPIPIRKLLDTLIALTGKDIPVELDPSRLRPSDVPLISCCHDKLTRDTGWQTEYSIDETLKDILMWMRESVQRVEG